MDPETYQQLIWKTISIWHPFFHPKDSKSEPKLYPNRSKIETQTDAESNSAKKRRHAIYRNETYGFQHFHKTKIRKTSMPIKSPLKCTWFRIPLLRMISTPKCFQNWSKTLPKSLKIRSKFLWKITHNLTGKSVTKLDTSQVFQSNTGWYQLLVFCLSAETQKTTFLFCSH